MPAIIYSIIINIYESIMQKIIIISGLLLAGMLGAVAQKDFQINKVAAVYDGQLEQYIFKIK